jgi:hypothetical protein
MGGVLWMHYVIIMLILGLPALLVLFSSKVRGYEKLGWALVSFFLSWLGFMVFLIVHASRPNTRNGG